MNRRKFLAAVPLALAAQAIPLSGVFVDNPQSLSSAAAQKPSTQSAGTHELDFGTALQAAEAIQRRQVSSVELTRRVFERMDRFNPQLNAFVYQLREQAMADAKKADDALAKGNASGVFHGVPINVKESFGVAGQPCTWGIPDFRNAKAVQDSDVVASLRGAGAVLLGATNVPVNLGDWQSYNPIYGQSNNPWDVKRTPGGSSGGSAAALAAGLGYLSAGSDIGGSIRVPCHFCGVYGHKPTLDLVSSQGQLPGGQRNAPGFSTLLAVCGPMARSARDLLAALKVMGGPSDWDAKAWKWTMPEPRAKRLKDFRVGFVMDDPIASPTAEEKAVLEKTIQQLEHAGVKLKQGWPQGYDPRELVTLYRYHLDAFFFSITPPAQQKKVLEENKDNPEAKNSGAVATFADWQQKNFRRLGYRAQWQRYFEDVDVFLSPVAFTPAFPHDHSEPMGKRKIHTSAEERKYLEMFNWIAAPTLTGCPATAAPVGRTADGLPVAIQIMGPFWEDATPITFADLLSREIGGFVAPKGYE